VRHCDEVNVIGHQAVPKQAEIVKLRVLPKEIEKGEAVGVGREDHLARVPSLRHVMSDIEHSDTGQASHGEQNSRDLAVW
jgi:hypothetical protein